MIKKIVHKFWSKVLEKSMIKIVNNFRARNLLWWALAISSHLITLKIKVGLIQFITFVCIDIKLEKNNNSQEVNIDIGSLGDVILN